MAKRSKSAWLLLVGGAIGMIGLTMIAPLRAEPQPQSQLRLVARQPQVEARPAPIEPLPPPAAPRSAPHAEREGYYVLAELETLAWTNHPTLVQAAARVDAQRGQWLQVGLSPNPTFGYIATEVGNDGQAGQQGLYFSQELVTAGKLGLNRQAAAWQVRQAQQQLSAQQQRVINDVRTGFYDVLIAQRQIDATRELVRIGDESVRTTEDLFRPPLQEVSRVELLQARIEADAARLQSLRAINRHTAAWRQLTAVIGVPQLHCAPLAGDVEHAVPNLEWCESLNRLLASSPELAAAQAEVGRANWALRRAAVEPKPNVQLQAGTQYDDASGYQVQFVQAGVAVPLFDRNQGNIRKAEAEIAGARADVARLELHLQNRLATAFERYSNARQQVDLYSRQMLPNAKASLDIVAAGFKRGDFNYLTLLTAQRTFAQNNLAYLDALRELRQSVIAIDGLLLGDSLAVQSP